MKTPEEWVAKKNWMPCVERMAIISNNLEIVVGRRAASGSSRKMMELLFNSVSLENTAL